jgi:cytochrome P450
MPCQLDVPVGVGLHVRTLASVRLLRAAQLCHYMCRSTHHMMDIDAPGAAGPVSDGRQSVDMSTSPAPADGDDFDPLAADFLAEPHPVYADLRDRCPVAHSDVWDFWLLTRYDDIVSVATRPGVFSSEWGITVPPNPVSGRRAPMHFDPPEHTAVRRAMNAPFRDERIVELEPRLREIARDLLDRALPAEVDGSDGVAELASRYASPFTSHALALFLGLPAEDGWYLDQHSQRFENAQFVQDTATAEAENQLMYQYARDLVALRLREPLDPGDDLISALLEYVHATSPTAEPGVEFVAGSLRQLFVAAHVAPRIAFGAGIAHLASDADLQHRLRAQPGLLPDAVEELLRMHTPNQGFARTARVDTELRGRRIRAGQRVALAYPSANRDPQVFPEPDRFDLQRTTSRHLAFGSGVHKCVGATLARVEMRVLLSELLAATDTFALEGTPVMVGWPMTGPVEVRVRVTRRPGSNVAGRS